VRDQRLHVEHGPLVSGRRAFSQRRSTPIRKQFVGHRINPFQVRDALMIEGRLDYAVDNSLTQINWLKLTTEKGLLSGKYYSF
jgi:hypothetical protein